jgi:hypothetical protein
MGQYGCHSPFGGLANCNILAGKDFKRTWHKAAFFAIHLPRNMNSLAGAENPKT